MTSYVNLLSLAEVEEFLENTLQLQFPMDRLKDDRAGFLRDVITSFHMRIPFQSVTAIATPRLERRRLTILEIKANMMTRQGGFCSELNYFIKVLLETLGFEVYHIAFSAFGRQNHHMANVLKNLNHPGDLHLVDVGTAYPLFRPIPLNFDKESPLYKDGFLTYKFVKDADGCVRWVHKVFKEYNDRQTENDADDWYTFMESDMDIRDFEFFKDALENIHTVESGPEALAPFLVSLRAVDFRNGRLFAIKDTTILEEDSSGKVNKKRISSPQELLEAYKINFPQFPVETVERALQTVSLPFDGEVC